MKITMKKDSKSKIAKLEAPIVLTPEQIAEIAAGLAVTSGHTTTSGGIPINPTRPMLLV
jgi:hypothetical protein